MSKHPVLLEISGRIATVTLNDPERRNPVTGNDMIAALLETFAKVQADPQVSVMILTGADPAFCAGGDIKEMNDPDSVFRKEPLAAAQSYVDGVQRLPLALYNMDIPTIAAVNGPAVGAGCDLTMMCDMRIASEKARFGEVFLNLGIIPGDAGSWFLLRRLGHQKAADLTFSGRMVEAKEALELGLVLELVPHEKLNGTGPRTGRCHRRETAARGAGRQASDAQCRTDGPAGFTEFRGGLSGAHASDRRPPARRLLRSSKNKTQFHVSLKERSHVRHHPKEDGANRADVECARQGSDNAYGA